MTLVRIAAAALALLVGAWFALGIRQTRATDRATQIISTATSLSPGQAAHARSLLRQASALNPDSEVDMLGVRLDLLEHHPRAAARSAAAIVRREPLNIRAWVLLAQAAYGDMSVVRSAVRHIAYLDPRG